MPQFSYKALTQQGKQVKGILEALNRAQAYKELEGKQLQPLSLVDKKGAKNLVKQGVRRFKKRGKQVEESEGIRLSQKQIMFFTEELSDLLDAGLQLEGAMRIIEQRKEASSVKAVARSIRQLLREGVSFSDALRRVSPNFGELYCKLVTAGEQSGALSEILKRKLENLILVEELKGKITSALIYPAFILLAGIALMFIFMGYLVPKLTSLFEQSGKGLPFLTQMLITLSSFVAHYWWALAIGIGGLAFGLIRLIKTDAGRMWWAQIQWKIPLAGKILSTGFFAQFAQTLGTLTANGIPLLGAIKLLEGTTNSTYLRGTLKESAMLVAEGTSLSQALGRGGVFPDDFLDMVVVGERTGKLPFALGKIANRFDKELNKSIERLTSLIQPVIIVVMAIVVGVVAFSMMSGIFQATASIQT